MNTSAPRSGTRLYQALAEKIIRLIASGEFQPGDRLPAERELASMFHVSRPTVREAVIALEIEGLVEVRVGSGVYVLSKTPTIEGVKRDIGAFELTEARRLIESEAAALAASNVTDEELDELERLLSEMEQANKSGAGAGETVDERFHSYLAGCSHNTAMQAAVEHLWTIRNRSPQCALTFEKSRAKGHKPVIEEHRKMLDALRDRNPAAARKAMRDHLGRVLQYLLDSTETEAIEQARAKVAAQRERFKIGEE
ncbi:FadR family transcriptional regulator [Erythrobacter sp. SN021]|uniref:FadR/GntR family transcriptional regulator n=1 Tax=Erythrobacter sp. SN021 TaxID=2912574 RepID=UPI001F16F3E6|nr:FadR/GntR family transcriptional regulator [Erythrobacter sp. SN021]MCF8882700.1 FadR family transcriptional regulator [Erythrobacter sp. SN021]